MLKSSGKRWTLTVAALTAAATLTSIGSAYGQATPIRFSNPPEPFTAQFGPGDDLCFASGGQITGTETTSGTHFQTDLGFHITIHDMTDYTIRYDDPGLPLYTGHAIDNLTYEGQTTAGSDTIVLTDHTTDRATAPDGSSIVVHETGHFSVLDVEPPDQSPGDVVHVSFDHFRFTCPQ